MSMTAAPFVIGLRQLPYYDSLQTPEALAGWFQQRLEEGLCEFGHSDLEKGHEGLLGRPSGSSRQIRPESSAST